MRERGKGKEGDGERREEHVWGENRVGGLLGEERDLLGEERDLLAPEIEWKSNQIKI